MLARLAPMDQRVCLEVLGEVLEGLEEEQARGCLEVVGGQVTSPDTEVRRTCLALMARQYSKREGEGRRTCLAALLSGLGDADTGVQQLVIDFLTSSTLLPVSSLQLATSLLTTFHVQSKETALVMLLPMALLTVATRATTFSSLLFTDPLDNCTFKEQRVDTDWRQQHNSALLPRFADTLASQSQSQASTGSTPHLRATQVSLEFTPTQGGAAPSPSLGSSLLVSPSQGGGGAAEAGGAPLLGKLHVGRRFHKADQSQEAQVGFFARRAATDRARARRREEEKRARKVALVRSYRRGDLPDIQVSYGDLVRPLLGLCRASAQFSETMFHLLLSALLEAAKAAGAAEGCAGVTSALSSLLAGAHASGHHLLSAAMKVVLQQGDKVEVDTGRLVEVASTSDLGPLAALAIEKVLREEEGERPAKRRKANEGEEASSLAWVRLSEVARHLGDWDTVGGIFTRQLATHPDTEAALALEARGEVRAAQDIYRRLLDTRPAGLPQEEALWTKGFYQSFVTLGQWEKLAKEVEVAVGGDLEGVWEGKEHLVGPLLSSLTHQLADQPALDNQVFTFLSKALKDKGRKAVVIEQRPVEVAAMLAFKKKRMEAAVIAGREVARRRLAVFGRGGGGLVRLLHLQAAAEMEEFTRETGERAGWGAEPEPGDHLGQAVRSFKSPCKQAF